MGTAISQTDIDKLLRDERDRQRRELIANLLLQREQNLGAMNVERERTSREMKLDLLGTRAAGSVASAMAHKEGAVATEQQKSETALSLESLRSDTALAREEIKADSQREQMERKHEQELELQEHQLDLQRQLAEMQVSSREQMNKMRLEQAGAETDAKMAAAFKAYAVDGLLTKEQFDRTVFEIQTTGRVSTNLLSGLPGAQQGGGGGGGGLTMSNYLSVVEDVQQQFEDRLLRLPTAEYDKLSDDEKTLSKEELNRRVQEILGGYSALTGGGASAPAPGGPAGPPVAAGPVPTGATVDTGGIDTGLTAVAEQLGLTEEEIMGLPDDLRAQLGAGSPQAAVAEPGGQQVQPTSGAVVDVGMPGSAPLGADPQMTSGVARSLREGKLTEETETLIDQLVAQYRDPNTSKAEKKGIAESLRLLRQLYPGS